MSSATRLRGHLSRAVRGRMASSGDHVPPQPLLSPVAGLCGPEQRCQRPPLPGTPTRRSPLPHGWYTVFVVPVAAAATAGLHKRKHYSRVRRCAGPLPPAAGGHIGSDDLRSSPLREGARPVGPDAEHEDGAGGVVPGRAPGRGTPAPGQHIGRTARILHAAGQQRGASCACDGPVACDAVDTFLAGSPHPRRLSGAFSAGHRPNAVDYGPSGRQRRQGRLWRPLSGAGASRHRADLPPRAMPRRRRHAREGGDAARIVRHVWLKRRGNCSF